MAHEAALPAHGLGYDCTRRPVVASLHGLAISQRAGCGHFDRLDFTRFWIITLVHLFSGRSISFPGFELRPRYNLHVPDAM